MAKTFVITYEHISGPGERTSNGCDELMRDLELLDNDSYVINSTISINTIEPKVEPLPAIEVANDPIEEARIKEMLRFAGKNY